MGTCKMAKREEGGVVDGSLNVYGVEGLKVAGKCAYLLCRRAGHRDDNADVRMMQISRYALPTSAQIRPILQCALARKLLISLRKS